MDTETVNKLWDYAAYAAIPDDGLRHEIIEGEHFVSPAPSLYHQEVSRHIQFQLYQAIEIPKLGFVIDAPVDVQLGANDIVQPDLVVILAAHRSIMTPTKVKGVPDLVIEVLSASNANQDLVRKRQLYQARGVKEYWIVDPFEHQILQLILRGQEYVEQILSDSITMHSPPHVTVDLKRVW
jgi:Uma2 family endonuclease